MTAPLFAAHPGCHCAARDRAPFFRRLRWRRKPAVPAGSAPAGAATVLLAGRFKCCVHCEVPTRCDPADSHPKACSDGCNRVAARNDVTAPSGWPVLGERMLSEVRAEYDQPPAVEYSGPPIYAVRGDGLIRVSSANRVDIHPLPLVSWWPTDATAAFPAVTDDTEVVYHRADHGEIDREFTDRPGYALLKRVRAGLLRADAAG